MPLRVYVDGWRLAKNAPPQSEFKTSLETWFPVSREELLEQFSNAVHQRINANLPWWNKGRKWREQWQFESRRAARDLNTPRLAIHWLPFELRKRFADRISNPHEL